LIIKLTDINKIVLLCRFKEKVEKYLESLVVASAP